MGLGTGLGIRDPVHGLLHSEQGTALPFRPCCIAWPALSAAGRGAGVILPWGGGRCLS